MTGLDCIRVAQALSHPRAMAMAAIYAGQLLLLRREPDAAIERCRTATSLADQHGLSFYLFFAQMLAGCAAVQRGEGERGVEAIKRGFDAWQGLGSALGAPWFLGEFAAGLCSIGRYDEALEVVRDALGRSEESGDRQFAPELRRIAGVALRRKESWSKPKALCAAQSRSLERKAPGCGSCARRPGSRDCSTSRDAAARRARCWPGSTAGSPRASTLLTLKMRERCSMS